MPVGDLLDLAQRGCRLARRDETLTDDLALAKEAVGEGQAYTLAAGEEWGFLLREDSFSLPGGTSTRTYSQLKTDLGIQAADSLDAPTQIVDDTNGTPLEALSWPALEDVARTTVLNSAPGLPRYWAVSEDQAIRFWPPPLTPVALRVRYRLRPGLLTGDASSPVIPAAHANVMLPHYAAWKLLLQESGDAANREAERHYSVYERCVENLRRATHAAQSYEWGLVEPDAFTEWPDHDGWSGW